MQAVLNAHFHLDGVVHIRVRSQLMNNEVIFFH
uniref:Uncharacterized protein n=1 Tax=Anguilla anguilla TaxID=7936 RepID=A0A0E9TTI9_ANGAN